MNELQMIVDAVRHSWSEILALLAAVSGVYSARGAAASASTAKKAEDRAARQARDAALRELDRMREQVLEDLRTARRLTKAATQRYAESKMDQGTFDVEEFRSVLPDEELRIIETIVQQIEVQSPSEQQISNGHRELNYALIRLRTLRERLLDLDQNAPDKRIVPGVSPAST